MWYNLLSQVSLLSKLRTCFLNFFPEPKGGSPASDRDIDPSRLDLRVGNIVSAEKV